MILSKYNLKKISAPGIQLPEKTIFELPEKVLQFGTGVLLRGLPDYFIDKANKRGIFNGRIVVIKSTGVGSATDFDKQDGLYTIYSRGVENAVEVNKKIVCSAISRVLSAVNDWEKILEVAQSPDLQLIISNTTEVGIQLVKDDVRKHPPVSFPGKLLAVLYARYKTFNGNKDRGLIIIPTELIVDNGKKLESIVLELAHLNKLEPAFMDWIESSNKFCNSLVDRIVPGKPDGVQSKQMEEERGYVDNLAIVSEIYSLWVIEGDPKMVNILSFSAVDDGVIIAPDIELFRELKLRVLNGTHTLSCAFAYLSGFNTVKEAMDDESFLQFISTLIFKEIIPSIPYEIKHEVAVDFANKVLDRFRNPYIRHEWLSISVQYSSKLRMRVVPLLQNYYRINNSVPQYMAWGFAAFLRFMKIVKTAEEVYTGTIKNREYIVTDSQAEYFCKVWGSSDIDSVVETVLKNRDLWESDLTKLPGFKEAVSAYLNRILSNDFILANYKE